MKKLIATIVLMMAFSAQADTTKQGIEDCTAIANIYGQIARLHQDGAPLTDVLAVTPDFARNVVIHIYSNNTRYGSQEYQDNEVTDTKNSAMINCLKNYK